MDRPTTSKQVLGAPKAVPSKQDRAGKLTSEEKVVKAEVESLLQDGLDKLEAEEETEEQKEDQPIEEEIAVEGTEGDKEMGDTVTESDGLQEGKSPPSEEAEGTTEQEEEEKGTSKTEEEEEDEGKAKQTLRPPTELWGQCRKKIIGDGSSSSGVAPSRDGSSASGVRRRLSSLPLSYFTSFAKSLQPEVPAAQEEKEEKEEKAPTEEQAKPRKYRPMLSRLFTFIPHEGKPKAVLRKPTVLLGENISRASKIIIEKSSHENTKQDKVDSDVPTETEREDGDSRTPESLQEGGSGSEKQDEAAGKSDGAHPRKLKDESSSSYPGFSSSVWSMGQRISHWKMAHTRGYHAGQLTQDKIYKYRLLKHERDTKAAVPLPLQSLMEEEVYTILKAVLLDYQKKLGVHHPLTMQMEDAMDHLHLQLTARGTI